MAPEVGLEPTTTRLTVACSTIELLRNRRLRDAETTGRAFYGKLFLQGRDVLRARVGFRACLRLRHGAAA